MSQIIQKYLKKRAILSPWKFTSTLKSSRYKYIFVIPAYAELEELPQTIQSIEQQNQKLLEETLTVIVVNNGKGSPRDDVCNNQETLKWLSHFNTSLEIAIVDASSTGMEIPKKHVGVGIARKIGMDFALQFAVADSLFCCTDADTILESNYLEDVTLFQKKHNAKAMVVGFSHQKSENENTNFAIKEYETFLFETASKIMKTGSPYGYVSLGSAIVCTAETYASVGGMPKRKATEDFYFLQECAKFCGVHSMDKKLVHPSSRISDRVYLGTGFRMQQVSSGLSISELYYSDEAFILLQKWLIIGLNGYKQKLDEILLITKQVSPKLTQFILRENIEDIWDGIQTSSPSIHHFYQQFHRWFDGLKTIRLLKHFSKFRN